MVKGRIVLCQKDPNKGNEAGQSQPISFLPFTWKLLIIVISNSIYNCLDDNEVLPNEQRGCRCNSRGTKDKSFLIKSF